MKTLKFVVVLLALVALVLSGCSDQISSSLDPASKSLTGDQILLKPVIHSATGGVHNSWFYGAPYYDNCTFNAKEYNDGSFSGIAKYFDNETGIWIQGEVIDLKVDNGNRAKVSCEIRRTKNTPPEYEGITYLFFVVIDNGEGSGYDPDIASWFIVLTDDPPAPIPSISEMIAMSSEEFLDWLVSMGLDPPTFDYLNGTVQVH